MSKYRLAILTPKVGEVMETFIRNHILGLPFEITVIHGGYLPWICDDLSSELTRSPWAELKHRLRKRKMSDEELKRSMFSDILKAKRIDAVLAEYVLSGAAVASVCKELEIPLIATGLGYELSVHAVLEKNRDAYRTYLSIADHTVVVARNMIDTLVEIGGDPEKMTWSAAGPSEDFFSIEADCSSQDFFMLGRMVEKKAPHISIGAFAAVLEKFPKARLLIGGDGPLLENCKELVAEKGIEDNVLFLGRIDQREQREILKTARAFVQHSIQAADGDREGTPVAIVEAAGAGVPVISTLHSGIPDTVLHDKSGLLSAEGDEQQMSVHMEMLLTDKDLALRMGAAGRELMHEQFSLNQHLATLTRIIQDSIEKKQRR